VSRLDLADELTDFSGVDGGSPNWAGLAFAAVLVLAVAATPLMRELLSWRKRP
jgi:hypothetical protein